MKFTQIIFLMRRFICFKSLKEKKNLNLCDKCVNIDICYLKFNR